MIPCRSSVFIGRLVGQLPGRLVEPLSAQPAVMDLRPRVTARIDDPLSQQRFRPPDVGPASNRPGHPPGPAPDPGPPPAPRSARSPRRSRPASTSGPTAPHPGRRTSPDPHAVGAASTAPPPHTRFHDHSETGTDRIRSVRPHSRPSPDPGRPDTQRRTSSGSGHSLRRHTSPVTASNACPVTDLACTSNPTNVRSFPTEASRNLWLYRTRPKPARQPTTNCERGLRPAHTV